MKKEFSRAAICRPDAEGRSVFMNDFFKLRENGTTVLTEAAAGLTTFFTMAYIIAINPAILSQAGMEWGAVFLATIIAAVIGTLVMGLVANVPYAQAPGMGLNAFFVYTVCFGLGFTWQQALSMVFICGILNILITVTKLRKYIIKCIPRSLQHAIGGGIGLFISYIGLLNVGFIKFDSGVPALATFNDPQLWLFLIGLALTIVLLVRKVPGAILIGIVITSVIGIPMGVTTMADTVSFREACAALPTTVGVIFTPRRTSFSVRGYGEASHGADHDPGIQRFRHLRYHRRVHRYRHPERYLQREDEKAMENSSGFKSKMDRALFADAAATSIGAIFGTSNTTTYVESAAGIAAGGRTGLTSVVVAVCFALSAFLAAFVSAIPYAATAPALVSVGVMMTSAFKEINWEDFEEAVPAFFASLFMTLCYSISDGIAFGFITYCLVKICKKEAGEVHPILWAATFLFLLNFVLLTFI